MQSQICYRQIQMLFLLPSTSFWAKLWRDTLPLLLAKWTWWIFQWLGFCLTPSFLKTVKSEVRRVWRDVLNACGTQNFGWPTCGNKAFECFFVGVWVWLKHQYLVHAVLPITVSLTCLCFKTTKDKRLILQLYFAANQTCRRSTFHIVTLVQPLDPNTNVGISGNVLFFFQLINTSQPTAKMNLQRYNECCATVQCHYAWLMSYVLTVFVKGQFKSVAVIVTIFTSLNQLSSEPEAFLWEMHIWYQIFTANIRNVDKNVSEVLWQKKKKKKWPTVIFNQLGNQSHLWHDHIEDDIRSSLVKSVGRKIVLITACHWSIEVAAYGSSGFTFRMCCDSVALLLYVSTA